MAKWLDFDELKQRLSFEAVLRHYGVELKLKGGGKQHQGFCPLSGHNGQKRSPSFNANLERNIFNCFGCGAKGNILRFAVLMEGLDPANGSDFRKVAIKLQEIFLPETVEREPGETQQRARPQKEVALAKPEAPAPAQPEGTGAVRINAPLNFELKELDASHPYLSGRGFTPETIAHFGLGFCTRGLMKDRVVIPLHDSKGQLIGYAGRVIDDTAINAENPKYKFPGKREHKGETHEFHKSLFLYNGHRITRPCHDLIVVEGFTGVWWLSQSGYHNSVGLMGADCGDAQAQLIVETVAPEGRVWIFPDADPAGSRCGESVFVKVAPHRSTRLVRLDAGKQPTDCPPEMLATLLSSIKRGGQP